MSLLFVITGASGAGKSTIIDALKEDPTPGCRIYDFDQINRPYDGSADWEEETVEVLIERYRESSNRGIHTIIGGLIRPLKLQKVLKKHQITVTPQFCLLQISIEERKRRIMQRDHDYTAYIDYHGVVEHLERWILDTGYPYITIDTTHTSATASVRKVREWIIRVMGS